MEVKMLHHPTEQEWLEVKQRALVTVGKTTETPPTNEWKVKMLKAGHSPIRHLQFSFYLTIPSWVSVHLCRHIHAQPYVLSQRNDRQNQYDRNEARQDIPVNMIWDFNAEELITIAHKRLCKKASLETRAVVQEICNLVIETNPEFKDVLVPLCVYRNGLCDEFNSCKKGE